MLATPAEREQAPATAIDAKFSLPFTVATALSRGEVSLDSFGESARADAQVLAMARRVQFRLEPAWGGDAARGSVTLRLDDGRELQKEILQPRGCPGSPMSETQLVEKFVDCLGRASRPTPPQAARALAARLLAIETEPDAGAPFGT
jgi:2-methylcitrate dehydratase PrpD